MQLVLYFLVTIHSEAAESGMESATLLAFAALCSVSRSASTSLACHCLRFHRLHQDDSSPGHASPLLHTCHQTVKSSHVKYFTTVKTR